MNSKANKIWHPTDFCLSDCSVCHHKILVCLGYRCWLASSDGKVSVPSDTSKARHMLFSQLPPARRNGQLSFPLLCDVLKDFSLFYPTLSVEIISLKLVSFDQNCLKLLNGNEASVNRTAGNWTRQRKRQMDSKNT